MFVSEGGKQKGHERFGRMLEDIPSTALVEKKARFLVSRGLSLVHSGLRDCGSDSPVSDELST